MTAPSPLAIATWLVEQRALSIIPLGPRGKKPAIKWAEFQAARPTPDQLKTWFANGGEPNTGIVCGAVSRLVAIDCDSPEAIAWADAHLPPTPMMTRTAKGEHRFYRHPGGNVRNAVRINTGDPAIRIDVRGDGGYVVAPGSTHETGARYVRVGPWPPIDDLPVFDSTWISEAEPDSSPRHTAPVQTIRTVADVMARARAYLEATPPAVEGQGGDMHTFQVCCRLVRGFDLSDAATLELLRDWNGRCAPPWSDRELAVKIESARKYGEEPFGARRDAPPPRQLTKEPTPPSPSRLYGLDRLQARQPRVVFIVERMSDVDALVRIGVPEATCLTVGSRWTVDHVRQLEPCGVRFACILCAEDEAGHVRAEHTATLCHSVGVVPRILALSATITDWIAAGGRRDQLIQRVDVLPAWQPAASGEQPAATAITGSGAARRPVMVRLEDVQPASVSWLWERRLARGMLTLLVGDGGLGKSTVSLSMAAILSKGDQWPDKGHAPIGRTVILSAEDSLSVTIRPRLDALGADIRQIHALAAVQDGATETSFNLARDLDMLEQAIVDFGAALVIVDPLGAYFGGADSYKDSDVRAVLAPLAALADRLSVCVLGIMHISKGTDRSAQHRVLGSVGFVNAARLTLAVGRHPDDQDLATGRRLLAPLKQNICAPADTLSFSMVGEGDEASDAVRLVWSSERVDGVSVDQVLGSRPSSPRDREDQTEAEQVITDMLTEESWPLDAKQAIAAGREHGIPERTLRWTAKRMGIAIEKKGFRNGWQWHRPPQPATIPADEPARSLSPVAVAASAPIAASQVSEQIRGSSGDSERGIPEAASGNDSGREVPLERFD